jgi:hypothetical protein
VQLTGPFYDGVTIRTLDSSMRAFWQRCEPLCTRVGLRFVTKEGKSVLRWREASRLANEEKSNARAC